MIYAIYILLALIATITGSISGMGGGVIMKPVMDVFGDYDAAVIGLLTSVTVLVMTVAAVARQSRNKGDIVFEPVRSLFLALGAVSGGVAGEIVFKELTKNSPDASVKIIQNIVLLAFIALVIIYMAFKHKIKSPEYKSILIYFGAGVFLGVISSFLGIGGGPMNVAILMFLFGMNIKTAVLNSLITILFAQAAKLITMAISGFPPVTNEIGIIMASMAAAGVLGAFLGSLFQKKMSKKSVEITFNIIQVIVIGLCIYNIISLAI